MLFDKDQRVFQFSYSNISTLTLKMNEHLHSVLGSLGVQGQQTPSVVNNIWSHFM